MSMRIGGLASGMDIDQLVSDLMKAERIPLNKLEQKKQYLEWQRDDFREMNTQLLELDQLIFEGVSKQASFTKKTITSSNPDAVTATNINSTNEIAASIKVNELAKGASMFSHTKVDIDPTAKLSDEGVTVPQTFTIQAIGADGKLQENPTSIEITAEDTLNTVLNKINSQSNVSAFFDEVTGKLSFTTKYTGDAKDTSTDPPTDVAEIILGGTGTFLTDTMNLHSDNQLAEGAGVGSLGVDADFEYNGLRTTRSSNTFRINGFEYSLKQTTTEEVTFSSSPDVDNILDTIVKFVDKYNELIEKIDLKTSERANRNYQPLTKEERDSLSEKEIERWEEQARKGTLYRDSVLSSSLTKMRQDLYTPVSGAGISQLADIGIKTSSNYLEKGKLIIDEGKLREAISSNPNGIYELFQKDGSTTNEQGLARRLRASIKDTMSGIESKAGKTSSTNNTFLIGRNLNNVNSEITRFEDRLTQVEDRYWRQFTAMEKAIQRSNEQSMFLMNQFG